MAHKTITFLNYVGSRMGITRNTNRPGPLHTCGVASLSIAQKAYKRSVEDLPTPIAYPTQKIALLMSPILYIIQTHWLASLSFTDYQILAIQNIMESVFPPLSHVFNKIDTVIYFSETLPEKFDYAVDNFPVMIRPVSILNWVLAQVVLLWSFLVSILRDWGIVGGTKEKEIRIDMNSHGDRVNKPGGKTYKEAVEMGGKSDAKTYKEVVEMGGNKRENNEKENEIEGKMVEDSEVMKNQMKRRIQVSKNDERKTDEDSVLDLFSLGWHRG